MAESPDELDDKSPAAKTTEFPSDFDQYEHPYNYDNELPDDEELKENLWIWGVE